MNVRRYLLIATICYLLAACTAYNSTNLLPIKILGLWGGQAKIASGDTDYKVSNRLLFLPFNILIVDTHPDDGGHYYDLYRYRFTGEDKVSIKGRIVDSIQIKLDQYSIIINSTHGFPPSGRYTRIISFWLCLLILVLVISITFLLLQIRIKSRKNILNLNN